MVILCLLKWVKPILLFTRKCKVDETIVIMARTQNEDRVPHPDLPKNSLKGA